MTHRLLILGTTLLLFGSLLSGQEPRNASPTFTKDVAPIFYNNCVTCHRPGEIAPMSLLTYNEVRPWARSIREKVQSGVMPPWHADAKPGTFRNERILTEQEKQTIVDWVDRGAPEGDPRDLPKQPTFVAGWTIGKPDAVFTMTKAFNVPASGEVSYQYFQVPTNFPEDKWIQAIEIRPGTPSVVHHVLVFSRAPNPEPRSQVYRPANPGLRGLGEALSRALGDAIERRTATNNRGDLIATTAPGTNAQVFSPGQALRIKAGSVLTFQMHYTANGKPEQDQTSVGFIFANEPPAQEVLSSAFVNAAFQIPPGAENHRVDSAIEFVQDSHILALFPHTHLRGKSWEYRLVYPDGHSEVVLSAPRYDFNWQTYYEFTEPLAAPKGSRLEGTAYYDNSTSNRSNPDPTVAVRWGDQTWEEMQYTGITLVVDGGPR